MTVLPLTERVFARLGPPRALWFALWAAILAVAYIAAHRSAPAIYPGLAYAIVGVYVAVLSLWGAGLIARRIAALWPDLQRLMGPDEIERVRPFARVNSVWGPIIFSVLAGLLWEFVDFLLHPGAWSAVITPLIVLGWIPANAALWVIGIVLIDLDRLGRSPLRLVPFEEDATLGLRPLGSLAVTIYAMVSAAMVPLMIVGAVDLRTFLTVVGQYVVITALFVLSLWRLHAQLQRAKSRHVAEARALCARAFRSVQVALTEDGGGEAAAAARLAAAEAVERRAQAIHEWPLGSAMFARAAAIFTAVIAGILVRIVLVTVGL